MRVTAVPTEAQWTKDYHRNNPLFPGRGSNIPDCGIKVNRPPSINSSQFRDVERKASQMIGRKMQRGITDELIH